MKRRIVSVLTALALVLSLCPTWAFAVEGEPDTGLCDHHQEHIGCGYVAPTEGQPCGHVHTDECYTEETLCVHAHDETCYSDGLLPNEGEEKAADACTHTCSAESGCVTTELDCQHVHDEDCGYVQADPGQPCGYECRICPIEALINALPNKVTEENRADVEVRLQEILALFAELPEDQLEMVDITPCLTLQEQLDEASAPAPMAEIVASVTINGTTTDYDSIQNAWAACISADYQDSILTLHKDVHLQGDNLSYTVSSKAEASTIFFRGGDYRLTSYNAYGTIRTSHNLTIESGSIENTAGIGIEQYNGILTLQGGAISCSGNKGVGIKLTSKGSLDFGELHMTGGTVTGQQYGVQVSGGTALIEGGTICTTSETGVGVYGSAVQISGGNISGGVVSSAVLNSSGNPASELLVPGYLFCDPDSKEPVNASGTKTQSSVVVLPHTGHTYGHWQDRGDGTHARACTVCRFEESGEHNYSNGTCTDCDVSQSAAVARVEYNGSSRTYTDLNEAWTAAINGKDGPATITLLQSVTQSDGLPLVQGGDVTFKMENGVSLSVTSGTALSIRNGNVTLDNCTITGSRNGVDLYLGGVLTVKGGSITGANGHGIYVGTQNTNTLTLQDRANITGGVNGVFIVTGAPFIATGCTFSGTSGSGVDTNGPLTAESCAFNGGTGLTPKGKASLTNCTVNANGRGISLVTGSSIAISDGSYTGTPALYVDGNPSVKLTGGTFNGGIQCVTASLQGLLETAYAYYIGNAIQTLEGTQKELAGNVTVKINPNYQPPTDAAIVIAAGDNTVHGYTSFADAWNFAKGKTARIRLLQSQELSSGLYMDSGDVTLEMDANVELTSAITGSGAMLNVKGGTLTLNGGVLRSTASGGPIAAPLESTGTVNINGSELEGYSYAIQLRGNSTLNISSGSLSVSATSGYVVDVYTETPKVNISEGTFTGAYGVYIEASTTGASVRIDGGTYNCSRCAVRQSAANSTLEIHGGTFKRPTSTTIGEYDCALSSVGNTTLYGGTFEGGIWAGSGTLAALLAEGKLFYGSGDTIFTDTASSSTKTSPLTVRDCTHGETQCQPNEGGTTHRVVCALCGQTLPGQESIAHQQGAYISNSDGTHSEACQCGHVFETAPHTLGEENRCGGCGMALAAQVEKGGATTYYTTIEDAWAAATGNTATVTLLDNVTVSQTLTVSSGTDITLEMKDGATFTNNSEDCFQVLGGKLTLAGGTVVEGKSGKSVVYAGSGTLCVTGGTYQSAGNGFWIDSGVNVTFSSGTISASGTALRYAGHTVKDMLADGYTLCHGDGSPVTSGLDGETLTGGTYTVAASCRHPNLTLQGTCTGTCPDCGETVSQPHQWSSTGVCGNCHTQAAAKIEKDGTTTYVTADQLKDEFDDIYNTNAIFTLLADVERTDCLDININCTLDLNGHTIHFTSAAWIDISSKNNVTIRDQSQDHRGQVISDQSNALSGGKTTILEGGTFTSKAVDAAGVRITGMAAKLIVTNENVVIQNTGDGYGLVVISAQSVQLSAGTYSGGIKISNNSSATLGGLLAEPKADGTRYAYFNGTTPITGKLDDKELSGEVTVKACNHSAVTVTDNGDGTHSTPACPACGKEATASEAHDWTETTPCTVCGAVAVAKVETNSTTTYYTTMETALAAAQAETSATITLLANVELTKTLVINNGEFTLDLGEYRLNCGSGTAIVLNGGDLTISGGGSVHSNNDHAVTVSGGTLTLGGGSFSSGISYKGVNIYTGTLKVTRADVTISRLTVSSGGPPKVSLAAGTYTNGIENNSSMTFADMLGHTDNTRYAYYNKKDTLITKLTGALLKGPITVKKCDHTGEGVRMYHHNENTFTHSETCLACGYKDTTPEDCAYKFSGTTGTCAMCGDSVTVAVSGAENLIYDGTEKKPGVTVTRGETTLAAGNYTVAYTDNTNAGTAKVTVAIGGGTYTEDFTIGPATPKITWSSTSQELTYNGNPAAITTPTVTLVNNEQFEGTISYSHQKQGETAYKDGLPTDVGTYTIKAHVDAAGNYTAADSTNKLTIKPAPVTLTFNNQTITYGGTPTEAIADPASTEIEYSYTGTTTGNGWPTNAGTYTVTAKVKATGNYGAATATAQLIINKAALTIESATVKSKTYDKNTTATVETVTFTGLKNGETLALGTDYTATGTFENENVGTGKSVTVTVTLKDSTKANNYTLTSSTVNTTAAISKAGSSIITAPTASGIIYGQALSASTLTGGEGSVAGAFSWTDGTAKPSAGTAQFEVTFTPTDENYNTATVNVSVTVAKATPTLTWASATQTVDYTGRAAEITTPTVTLVNGESFSGPFSYSYTASGSSDYVSGLPVNAGTYTVKASIAEQGNYTAAESGTMTLTISKVDYTGEKAGNTSGKFGMTKTYDLKNLLPEGYKLGTPTKTDTNGIFTGEPTVSGTKLTYQLANAEQNIGKTGTITVPVTESTNYNPFNLEITVTVSKVRIPDLDIDPISVTYTGNPVGSDKITGTATVDGTEVKGTWSFAEGQALTNVSDSGTKRVLFNPADTSEYGPATGTTTVTITKATPSLTLTPSHATLPNGGTVTLTLSGLPEGGEAAVSCSDESITVAKGSGDTWTAELPAGGASYTFTATYAGDENHNEAEAACTVSVDKRTPALVLTPSANALPGGGTVTLTLSGLPAGETATVICSGGITVTKGTGSTWTAILPNSTATYTFTASFAGNDSYHGASASCTVETREVVILPNPPADDGGTKFQLVMENGISEVPAGLQGIEALNTPAKLETVMKTEITKATPDIPQANTAVYDVALLISMDGGRTWTPATKDNFPSGGLTITLPYPEGTNSSYLFTVVHMFTTSDFGKQPGETEVFTPNQVRNTVNGMQVTVTGLSPISVGWTAPAVKPDTPPSGNDGGWENEDAGSVSTYAVTVERSEHGSVTSNRTNAASGTTVTLTAVPDSGYVLDTLTVTDSRGKEIKLTAQGGGKYTFTMPGRAVTVAATFAPLPDDRSKPCDGGADCPSREFTDLGSVGTWYHEAVDFVLRNKLMGGYGNGTFGPNDTLTRAQLTQILYNKEGKPAVTGGSAFADVADGAWYAPVITWAAERNIVGGYGNGLFGPDDNITREQLAVMLWRYAGSPAATNKELHFNDEDEISGYALDAIRWAVENGILNGKGGGILDPKGLATRAQTAQMLKNLIDR